MARKEYKTIVIEKKVIRSTIYNGACLLGLVCIHSLSHKMAVEGVLD